MEIIIISLGNVSFPREKTNFINQGKLKGFLSGIDLRSTFNVRVDVDFVSIFMTTSVIR